MAIQHSCQVIVKSRWERLSGHGCVRLVTLYWPDLDTTPGIGGFRALFEPAARQGNGMAGRGHVSKGNDTRR